MKMNDIENKAIVLVDGYIKILDDSGKKIGDIPKIYTYTRLDWGTRSKYCRKAEKANISDWSRYVYVGDKWYYLYEEDDTYKETEIMKANEFGALTIRVKSISDRRRIYRKQQLN